MDIIESFIRGKRADQSLCEDAIAVTDGFIAVFDGVTAKQKLPDGRPGGLIAAKAAAAALSCASPDADAPHALSEIDRAVSDAQSEYASFFAAEPAARGGVNAVIFSRALSQIWQYGDCPALLDGRLLDTSKEFDDVCANARRLCLEEELLRGKTTEQLLEHDTGREFIMPLLLGESLFVNGSGAFSYVVIDGRGIRADRTVITPVPAGSEVVLASDGWPLLCPTLEESEEALDRIRREDPLCMSLFVSTKGFVKGQGSFDDRAYIRFTV